MLRGGGRYIAARNPIAAHRFFDAVEHTVDLLTREPFLGYEAEFRRALGYRSFGVRGYGKFPDLLQSPRQGDRYRATRSWGEKSSASSRRRPGVKSRVLLNPRHV